jgi:hypothetical protein
LDGAELDVGVVESAGKVGVEDGNLGEDVVRCALSVGSDEGRPRRRGPVRDDETEEATVLGATGFGRPDVNRTGERDGGADLGETGGWRVCSQREDEGGRGKVNAQVTVIKTTVMSILVQSATGPPS